MFRAFQALDAATLRTCLHYIFLKQCATFCDPVDCVISEGYVQKIV